MTSKYVQKNKIKKHGDFAEKFESIGFSFFDYSGAFVMNKEIVDQSDGKTKFLFVARRGEFFSISKLDIGMHVSSYNLFMKEFRFDNFDNRFGPVFKRIDTLIQDYDRMGNYHVAFSQILELKSETEETEYIYLSNIDVAFSTKRGFLDTTKT